MDRYTSSRRDVRSCCHELALAIAVVLVSGSPAAAQSAPSAWGFTSVRADSHSGDQVYTGYGYGRLFAISAIIYSPGSTEIVGGVGVHVGSNYLVLAATKDPDSRYAQMYWLPAFALGPLKVEATMLAYIPLNSTGTLQLYVTPATVVLPVTERLALGASYGAALQERSSVSHTFGPIARLSIGGAETSVEWFAGVRHATGKLRLAFRAFY